MSPPFFFKNLARREGHLEGTALILLRPSFERQMFFTASEICFFEDAQNEATVKNLNQDPEVDDTHIDIRVFTKDGCPDFIASILIRMGIESVDDLKEYDEEDMKEMLIELQRQDGKIKPAVFRNVLKYWRKVIFSLKF